MDWFLYDRNFRHERVNLKTGKQAFKATETYLLTALEKRISKRDTFIEKRYIHQKEIHSSKRDTFTEKRYIHQKEIHSSKNVRKEVIGLRNLLKRIKFQTSKLKSILKK